MPFAWTWTIAPGQEAHADFVYPYGPAVTDETFGPYRGTSFESAVAGFRSSYWDAVLAPATRFEGARAAA